MRVVPWVLIPFALVAGAGASWFARGARTSTVTIVQVQTVAPPPTATKTLTAIVQGHGGASCLTASATGQEMVSHAFVLRRPGNGLTDGDVVGVAEDSSLDAALCNLVLTFRISPNVGFFSVHDATSGIQWGPFDPQQLAARAWTVRLDYSG